MDQISNEIIEKACKGDMESFEMIVLTYERRVISTLYRMLNDIERSKELAQDVFLKVYKALPKFSVKEGSSFQSWLFTIVRNTCFSQMRKNKLASFLNFFSITKEIENKNVSYSPEENISNNELKNKIDIAVSKLPQKQKMIFILREYENMNYEQIAEVMTCPIGTVRSNLSRAKENLKSELERYLND